MTYTANQMQSALLVAMSSSRHDGRPRHIIDRDGALQIVAMLTATDKVVVRDVQAPRKTRAMLDTVAEAREEIRMAMPYILRACSLVRERHKGYEAEEVMADILRDVDVEAAWDAEAGKVMRTSRPASFFTRLFGRVPY